MYTEYYRHDLVLLITGELRILDFCDGSYVEVITATSCDAGGGNYRDYYLRRCHTMFSVHCSAFWSPDGAVVHAVQSGQSTTLLRNYEMVFMIVIILLLLFDSSIL